MGIGCDQKAITDDEAGAPKLERRAARTLISPYRDNRRLDMRQDADQVSAHEPGQTDCQAECASGVEDAATV